MPFLGREFLSKHVALKVAHSGHLNIFFFSFPIFTDSIGFHAVASYLTLLTTTINYLLLELVHVQVQNITQTTITLDRVTLEPRYVFFMTK